MLQLDSAHIHSRARIEALTAEAEHDRLLSLLPRSAARPARVRRLRCRLALGLYALALRLDPSVAVALAVRPSLR
jgi:hypothetical protein